MSIIKSQAEAVKHGGASEPLLYTVWRSVSDLKSFETVHCTWPELVARIKAPKTHASKAACPLLKLASFGDRSNGKGSLRVDENVDAVFGVEGDYDAEELPIKEAVQRLRDAHVQALVYTSPSHTPEAPRYRILAPLSRSVAPSLRAELVSLLNGALGGVLAPESWVLSQTFYFGKVKGVQYEAHEVEGLTLDVLSALGEIEPIGPPGAADLAAGTAPKATRYERLALLESDDDTARELNKREMVKSRRSDGALNVVCPASEEHTTESQETTSVYYLPHTGGYSHGTFVCKHGHCLDRPQADFLQRLGFNAVLDEFVDETRPDGRPRFTPFAWHEFADRAAPGWIVRGILPQAELCVIYGESGSGKTFFALDLMAAIARGVDWRGHRVKAGRVVYIAAEGVGGFRNRMKAYAHTHNVAREAMQLDVIDDAPDLLGLDHKALAAAIGSASVVVVDTLAQATPGANENSGEDMGKALAHCKALHRATGALIVLIHHSGKDAARGARGWSGLKGACDAELEITRSKDGRAARVSKQKDGEEGESMAFKLQPVLVGLDANGDEISSAVVVAVDPAPVRRPEPAGEAEKLVLQVARDLLFDADTVAEGVLLTHAIEKRAPPAEGVKDHRRDNLRRTLAGLIGKNYLSRNKAGDVSLISLTLPHEGS